MLALPQTWKVLLCFCLSANLSMPLSVLAYQQQGVSSQPLSELWWHLEVICFNLPSFLSLCRVCQ